MSVSKSVYKGNCHVNILVFLISCVLRFVHVDICSYKCFVLLLKSISLYKYIESIFLLVSILLADNFFVVIPVVLLWTFLNIFLHIFRNILCEVFQFFFYHNSVWNTFYNAQNRCAHKHTWFIPLCALLSSCSHFIVGQVQTILFFESPGNFDPLLFDINFMVGLSTSMKVCVRILVGIELSWVCRLISG